MEHFATIKTNVEPSWIAQCEQERLHLSSAIQPHGVFIGVAEDGRVIHVSANVKDFLGTFEKLKLGDPAPAWLARLIPRILPPKPGSRLAFDRTVIEGFERALDIVTSRAVDGSVFLELFPIDGEKIPAAANPLLMSQPGHPFEDAVPTSQVALALAEQAITLGVAELTGFQRVMYYRFREDGDGEVVAEVRQGAAYGSYLGLRFPASDIPLISRKLYVLNSWRMIPDASALPVPVCSLGAAPDLTFVDLRSVSPVHQAYLANMGVGASLSFPVVVRGELYALIAAHRSNACTLSHQVLQRAADRVYSHAVAVGKFSLGRRMQLVDKLANQFIPLMPLLTDPIALPSHWSDIARSLCEIFECDGASLILSDTVLTHGSTFDPIVQQIIQRYDSAQNQLVWLSDSLLRDIPEYPASEIAGAIVIRMGDTGTHGSLYMTRVEHVHEVAWGGNPDKPIEQSAGGLNISPRRSFERWLQKRTGFSRQWTKEHRLFALKLCALFNERPAS